MDKSLGRGIPVWDWQERSNYEWAFKLPKRAFAWEWLRRDGRYCADHAAQSADPDRVVAPSWPLVRLEDPYLDVRQVAPTWRDGFCDETLRVVSGPDPYRALESYLNLGALRCSFTTVRENDEIIHFLFTCHARALQIAVHIRNDGPNELLHPVRWPGIDLAKRLTGIRRLNDLADTAELREALYRPDPRAKRFALGLQALDGHLSGASHRQIAIALFGLARVEQEWVLPTRPLQDTIRRKIALGKAMMNGRYLRLLAGG